jgi:hypothetical protein
MPVAREASGIPSKLKQPSSNDRLTAFSSSSGVGIFRNAFSRELATAEPAILEENLTQRFRNQRSMHHSTC